MMVVSRKHLGAEPERRAERELDVHPHGEHHVVVEQRPEHEGQPRVGQQHVVRVHLHVVHPTAVRGRDPPFRDLGHVAQPVRERHERVQVEHGRDRLHAVDERGHHAVELGRGLRQRRRVHVSQNYRTRAAHLLERPVTQVVPETGFAKPFIYRYFLLRNKV